MSSPVQWAALAPRILLEQLRGSGAAGLAELAPADAASPAAPASAARPVALSDPGLPPQGPQHGPPAHAGTRAEVSRDGKLLASLARIAGDERGKAVPATLLELIDAPSDGFARELKSSFERSGLFYEAHLRAWNSGGFSLADLRLEPQARFGMAQAAAMPAAAVPQAAAPASAESAPEPAQQAAAEAAETPAPRSAVAPELEPLVREQLATLESRVAVLPFMVWPGQHALLEVGEEPGGENATEAADREPLWRATLKLALARLGEVRFSITLQGEAVRIHAAASRETSRAEFAAAAPALRAALEASALRLERLELGGDGR